MNSTVVSDGQSLVDVAVQELGTVDTLFELADAAGLAITDQLSAGQLLPVPDSTGAVADVVSYFRQRGQRINTDAGGTCFPPFPNYLPDFLTGDWQAVDFLTTP